MDNNKKTLRKNLIALRQQIPANLANSAAQALSEQLLSLIKNGKMVAGYFPVNGEIDVMPVLKKLVSRGHKISLPCVMDGSKILKFLEFRIGDELVTGKFGISCPPPEFPEITPDILIVPIVGFDGNGNRLGYGGGYYDATIRHLRALSKQLLVIGVAYDIQRVDKIETHAGDEKMDMVVTEKVIIG